MRKKKERMELLWKIKQLTKKCECKEYDFECSNCNEMKKLGDELLNVTADCREARGVVEFGETDKARVRMTPAEYSHYRKVDKLLDSQIAKKKKITKSVLNRWKRKHGLVGVGK